ncbi:MAG: hypothetical protein HC773_13620 [Scytonema sp. CRU_2_7]|nr:hypothetical protein [Scytonema sp. CRU_2_7]
MSAAPPRGAFEETWTPLQEAGPRLQTSLKIQNMPTGTLCAYKIKKTSASN